GIGGVEGVDGGEQRLVLLGAPPPSVQNGGGAVVTSAAEAAESSVTGGQGAAEGRSSAGGHQGASRRCVHGSSFHWGVPAAPRRSFAAGGRDAPDEESLSEQEDEEDREQRDDRHCEQGAPGRTAAGGAGVHEAAQCQLHGVRVGVGQEDERPQEVVPGPDEGEDRGGGQRRNHQRQNDSPEDPQGAASRSCGWLLRRSGTSGEVKKSSVAGSCGTTAGNGGWVHPRAENRTYCGTSSTCTGSMIARSVCAKNIRLPRNRSRANA